MAVDKQKLGAGRNPNPADTDIKAFAIRREDGLSQIVHYRLHKDSRRWVEESCGQFRDKPGILMEVMTWLAKSES